MMIVEPQYPHFAITNFLSLISADANPAPAKIQN